MSERPRRESQQPLAFQVADRAVQQDGGRVDTRDIQSVPFGLSGADPRTLAATVFDIHHAPGAVKALFALRQLLIPLLGVKATTESPFRVVEVVDGQALMQSSDRHLTFWCSVGARDGGLQVATAVRLAGWRGRLYWLPVGFLHGPVTRAMMRQAVRRLEAATEPR